LKKILASLYWFATHESDADFFYSGSKAADELIQGHPHPHRLKVFLQLEANNMAIYLEDLFEKSNAALLDNALDEAIIGSLSYNGQRCTALKLHFCPSKHVKAFVELLSKRVEALSVGLPDETHADNEYSKITPLPNKARIGYMKELLDDAISKGAKIVNPNGGTLIGGEDSTLMVPAVLYPVTSDMRVYHEEQFGPIVPVTTYDSLDTVVEFGLKGEFGQQVSIFGQDSEQVGMLVDTFSAIFGKINLNSQCGRSPDTLPFAGRRSSAMGVMSVTDALREFSIPTVVSYKETNGLNDQLVKGIETKSNFLQEVK
jgi:glyceraldehyde-3-phosphate dehydrogenase (NADP+)